MAICSFLGNDGAYGKNLYAKLLAALKTIAEENENLDILLLPPQYESFFSFCLQAALQTKLEYPGKTTITAVVDVDSKVVSVVDEWPFCLFDRVLAFVIPQDKGGKTPNEWFALQRRVVGASTHIICCLYEQFYERENNLMRYAERLPHLKIIDVSDPEILRMIKTDAKKVLKGKELLVVEKLEARWDVKSVEALLALSGTRVRQIRDKAGRRLRNFVSLHYGVATFQGKVGHSLTCAIFSLGDATPDKLETLKNVLGFLTSRYPIKRFEIQGDHHHALFMSALEKAERKFGYFARLRGSYFRMDAIITDELCAEHNTEERDVMAQFSPHCKRVGNLDTTLIMTGTNEHKIITAMAERADFCICDLSSSPIAADIRDIARANHAPLLDIGNQLISIEHRG